MSHRNRIARLAVGLMCCALGACQNAREEAPRHEKPAPAALPSANAPVFFAGTAACSGQSCHGGLEPLPSKDIGQNEYTAWLTHDRHANAYRALLDDRSKLIAKNLGGDKKAHEDDRCLNCHVTSYAAGDSEVHARAESTFGVGCESCHGSAREWLGPHSTLAWKNLDAAEKRAKGFIDVRNPAGLAQSCVGCHIGAPPSKDGSRTRDVNHDLIAAGHPRLNFELDVFLDNLPPHWNEEAKKNRDGANIHARIWAHGQLASAQAALELLAYRADKKNRRPWPEFAEYDCFACHHDLQHPSWRQERIAGRRLGSLPWGTWNFTMPRLLGEALSHDKEFNSALDRLQQAMNRPAPDRCAIGKLAHAAVGQIKKLNESPVLGLSDDASAHRTSAKWLSLFADSKRFHDEPSWDAAMQLYLAAYSLDPSLRQDLKHNLPTALTCPERFDSPRSFKRDDLIDLLKRISTRTTP